MRIEISAGLRQLIERFNPTYSANEAVEVDDELFARILAQTRRKHSAMSDLTILHLAEYTTMFHQETTKRLVEAAAETIEEETAQRTDDEPAQADPSHTIVDGRLIRLLAWLVVMLRASQIGLEAVITFLREVRGG